MAINCLIVLGGIYDRKMYIPGETRELDKARKMLIDNGGLLALIFISYSFVNKNIYIFFILAHL